VFSETAELYDLIYTNMKDYREEATKVVDLVRSHLPAANRLLDVACGTAEHAKYLSQEHSFQVDGIDIEPAFVEIAGRKVPDGRFECADMVEFDLGNRYDAVLCLFSSIGYVKGKAKLERAIESMLKHVAPGGLLVVEPWFEPAAMQDGRVMCVTAESGGTAISRMSHTSVIDRISRLQFEYVIGDANGLRRASEVHELYLYTQSQMLEAFEASGALVDFDGNGIAGRGLYVGRRGS